ncbi:CDP-diacylglycerol--glycerol-3-phosphate 3-phosphatidyltransferase [Nakamurella silvestris]|nr:CDP-diacylglycerol--glycerol-3-phosphate 3-phosphatidyltransferase [Nakamurella silvestris]
MTAEQPVPLVNLPNILTVSRLILVPIGLIFLFIGDGHEDRWRIVAFIIFAIAAITDRYDGHIARKRGLVTDFGKIADPIADKALTGGVLVGLSILGDMPWWITIVILTRELGITVLRLFMLRYEVMAASMGGKIKTFVQVLAIGLYVLPWPDSLEWIRTTLMAIALLLTVGTGIDYIIRSITIAARAKRGQKSDSH